jgi:hypothetical protein
MQSISGWVKVLVLVQIQLRMYTLSHFPKPYEHSLRVMSRAVYIGP